MALLFISHHPKIFSILGIDCPVSQSNCVFCEISDFFQDGFEEAYFMSYWPFCLNIFYSFSNVLPNSLFSEVHTIKKKAAEVFY